MNWSDKHPVVTGGTSFIGSHLVEALLARGAKSVTVFDNLSSGKYEYVDHLVKSCQVDFYPGDLRHASTASFFSKVLTKNSIVFHLAADHGGRGYVETQQAACASNLELDGAVFRMCKEAKVEKVVFASSGCVYPNFIQKDPHKLLYLHESAAGPPYDADNMYGWAKLMAEKTLKAYHDDYGMKSASLRYFTVYGPRGKVDHAVMAMLARAIVKQDPFVIWGNGEQVRNWTFITDIVEGTILAAERVSDASAINLGTTERIRVIDAAHMAMELAGYRPISVDFKHNMPVGPANRVANNTAAEDRLEWRPKVPFCEGITRTFEWMKETYTVADLEQELRSKLLAR